MKNAYCLAVLVGKSEMKRPRGKLRRRWGSNIKMDFKDI
jgi:hypothetical protein